MARFLLVVYLTNNNGNFPKAQRRHRPQVHNTNNINDFLNDDYITHGTIDHDYSVHTLGIKGYQLNSLSNS